MIAAALRDVGAARSIVIDETNEVLAGNGVLEALPQTGISKLRVVDVDGDTLVAVRRRGLTPEQKRALAIYDNRTGELAEWNVEQLRIDLSAGLDLQSFFSAEEVAALLKIVEAPDVFKSVDENIQTDHVCPKCGYEWSRPRMKPPYQPLMMADVINAPLNGLTHVSTFSGAGGTCLGFRLAGFQTLWANDIEDHARQCYSANLSSPIDGRDIRHLRPEDILQAIGLKVGDLNVFEGSPPCTTFSTAGQRHKGWHKNREHAGITQSNIEDLFFEWLRLLEGLRPRAFVAENVAGLVKGIAKGYFKDILRRMKVLGYQTEAQLIDAQWLGVPQQRTRVIFIGVREDLQQRPVFPRPQSYRYSVRDALPWITAACYDTKGQFRGEARICERTVPSTPCRRTSSRTQCKALSGVEQA